MPEKVPGLTANDPNPTSVNIYSGNFYDAPYYGFSRLGIQADFKAWLREYNCVFGSYGLKITVDFIADEKIITDENGKETKTTDVTRRILYLNENDMVGNPYQFEDFYTQEKVFDISDYGGIAAISIDFYQDAGSFKMNKKDDNDNFIPVPYIDELGNKLFNNLFVYNWDIAIGYDISSYDTDVAKLYCLQKNEYSTIKDKKTIDLKWIHIDDNGSQIVMNQYVKDYEYEIRWYRYLIGEPSADNYCGSSWTSITNEINNKNIEYNSNNPFQITLIPDAEHLQTESIKAIILFGKAPGYDVVTPTEREYLSSTAKYYYKDNDNYINCLNISWDNVKDKQLFIKQADNRIVYKTQILEFKNQTDIISSGTIDALSALTLTCFDRIDNKLYGTQGNYLIYNQGNQLIDSGQSAIIRGVRCKFNLVSTEDDDTDTLKDADSVTWLYPLKNTMIVPQLPAIGNGIEYSQVNDSFTTDIAFYHEVPNITQEEYNSRKKELYYYNEETSEYINCEETNWVKGYPYFYKETKELIYGMLKYDNNAIKAQMTEENNLYASPYFLYKIGSYFASSKLNNYIQCIVEKDGVSYRTAKDLTFGQAGSAGTEYTFVLELEKNINALTAGEEATVKITGLLYDSAGKEQDLTGKTIEWGFVNPADTSSDVLSTLTGLSLIDGDDNANKKLKATTSLGINTMCIVQATLMDWGDYKLTAYLPIPIRNSNEHICISGATSVVYLTDGSPQYYNSNYQFYTTSTDAHAKNPSWKAIYGSPDVVPNSRLMSYFPELSERNSGTYLQPVSMFVKGLPMFAIQAYGGDDSTVYWTQPILMIENKYPSAMINEWDGKELKIDNSNNAILSKMIGAGRKENDNSFSGVLMGDWTEQVQNGTSTTMADYTGLFGFNKGEMSFSLTDDGFARIGKASAGQVVIDGNESLITSGAYLNTSGETGMAINLADSTIVANQTNGTGSIVSMFELNGQGVRYNKVASNFNKEEYNANKTLYYYPDYILGGWTQCKETDEYDSKKEYYTCNDVPIFRINDYSTNKTLMSVGRDDYYLESANYVNTHKKLETPIYLYIGSTSNYSTRNRWIKYYGSIWYNNGNGYTQITNANSISGYKAFYIQQIEVEQFGEVNGSRFDLNSGVIEFNQGYINGDIILQTPEGLSYTYYNTSNGAQTEKTLNSASLSSILSELLSTVSRVEYLANYAIDIAKTANSAASSAAVSINWLEKYFWDDTGGIVGKDDEGNDILKPTSIICFGHDTVKDGAKIPALKVSSQGISLVAGGTLTNPTAQFTSGKEGNGFLLSGHLALSEETSTTPGTYGTTLPTIGWEGRIFFKLKA